MADNSTHPAQTVTADFMAWHEDRMRELNYPPQIVAELRDARAKFFAWVRRSWKG